MEKRQVIFLVVCLAILITWSQFFKPQQQPPTPAEQSDSTEEAAPAEGEGETTPETTSDDKVETDTTTKADEESETTTTTAETTTATDETTTTVVEEAVEFDPQLYSLSNPFATFEISTEGGVVRQVTIETKETSKDHGIVVHGDTRYAFCPDDLPQQMYPLAIFSDEEDALDLATVEFKKDEALSVDGKLVLRHENAQIAVTKTFTLPEKGYRLEVELTVRNTTGAKLRLGEYSIQAGSVHPVDYSDKRAEVRITYDDGSANKLKPARDGKAPREYDEVSSVRWAAIGNKYFTTILDARGAKPGGDGELRTRRIVSDIKRLHHADEDNKRKIFATDMVVVLPDLSLGADEEKTFDLALYVGPKERDRLKELGYGKVMGTTFIAKLASWLMVVLNFIYGFIPNYGVAIILLTALMKLLLFPLDRRSFKSMKEMQKIQPLIKQLQEKHKDDKRQLQVEQMKLFKEHKVNPLGGCLPILLQFPVLFGMFTMLRNAVELWRAPFVSYITDLSKPDTLFTIHNFPLLGQLQVHVLPVLMTVFTLLSQRLRGQTQTIDPQQKMMANMMPVIFLVIFWSFPSGLNLYWLCSTVFSFSLQLAIQKSDDHKKNGNEKEKKKNGSAGTT